MSYDLPEIGGKVLDIFDGATPANGFTFEKPRYTIGMRRCYERCGRVDFPKGILYASWADKQDVEDARTLFRMPDATKVITLLTGISRRSGEDLSEQIEAAKRAEALYHRLDEAGIVIVHGLLPHMLIDHDDVPRRGAYKTNIELLAQAVLL